MAVMAGICVSCGEKVDVFVNQYIVNNSIAWSEAYSCKNCGSEIVSDDWGDETPTEFRQVILEQEGEWEFVVLNSIENRSHFLKNLRNSLGISLQEVSSLLKNIPGVLMTGTFQEMILLKNKLEIPDENVSISRTT